MECERKSKVRKLMKNSPSNFDKTEWKANLMDLPMEVLNIVASFLPRKYLYNFGLVNRKCQQIFQLVDRKNIDLSRCLKLDEKKMLDKARTRKYTCVNLNYCHWLSSESILELITKEGVRELKLIECQCTMKVIEVVAKMNLRSLSISMSSEWKRFFVIKLQMPIGCFSSLKKLKVFYLKTNTYVPFLDIVPHYVIRHFHNLEYLKLFTNPNLTPHLNSLNYYDQTNGPTPLPKLESLVLNLHCNNDISKSVNHFLKLILNQKEVPLKRVFLGKSTFDVISSGGISCLKNATFENSRTLCLSSSSPSRLSLSYVLKVDGCESMIESTLRSSQCKEITIENVKIGDIARFTELIVKSGNTRIEKISLLYCTVEGNICRFIDEIRKLSSGITFLDLRIDEWNTNKDNNSLLMNSLAKLTSLSTLYIIPAMLSGQTDQEKMSIEISFWEVTQKCKCLENLRITDYVNQCDISYDVLVNIKLIESLKELHLVRFTVPESKDPLPEITERCSRLNYLKIKDILILKNDKNELLTLEFLAHAKQIKHLRLDGLKITKQFVDDLTRCTQLENLCVLYLSNRDDEIIEYFASNLKNFTKLKCFILSCSEAMRKRFKSAIAEIDDVKKPHLYDLHYDPRDYLPVQCHMHSY